jgi:hypothetical protein
MTNNYRQQQSMMTIVSGRCDTWPAADEAQVDVLNVDVDKLIQSFTEPLIEMLGI